MNTLAEYTQTHTHTQTHTRARVYTTLPVRALARERHMHAEGLVATRPKVVANRVTNPADKVDNYRAKVCLGEVVNAWTMQGQTEQWGAARKMIGKGTR